LAALAFQHLIAPVEAGTVAAAPAFAGGFAPLGCRNEMRVQGRESAMTVGTILLILLILLLLGAIPAWPYSRGWGYYPSGFVTIILIIIIILLLMGRI
jgi:Protein of unknown function (DUF3309)